MKPIYFNEFDRFPAAWLRQLFPDATVDERSIHEIQAADLARYRRVHLFGGIGGWEYALRLAGWREGMEQGAKIADELVGYERNDEYGKGWTDACLKIAMVIEDAKAAAGKEEAS